MEGPGDRRSTRACAAAQAHDPNGKGEGERGDGTRYDTINPDILPAASVMHLLPKGMRAMQRLADIGSYLRLEVVSEARRVEPALHSWAGSTSAGLPPHPTWRGGPSRP